MFIITRYILKEHIGPFIFGLMTIVLIFLLNIIFRDLGRLLGKGLSVGVILEFFVLNLAWIVALAIPMSVLIATLMAFGRLSSDNEITALKASGVNLYRLITPMLIAAALLAIGMERFNNCVLPDFNHRVRLLYSDISKKRPTLTLEPHVFFNEIPNYTLFVQNIKKNGDLLEGIIIDDHSDSRYSKTIIAEKGHVRFSREQEKMIFSLFNGEVHEIELKDLRNYRRLKFQRQVISIPVPNMVLKRSNSQYRGNREKSASMMRADIKENKKAIEFRENRIREIVRRDLAGILPETLWNRKVKKQRNFFPSYYSRGKTLRRVEALYQEIHGERSVIYGYRRSISALRVEIHKKYSIPVACIVFVLVGAPLGIMARQGGLVTGGGLSLIFFLIYWVFLIGGEQLADRRIIGPVVAMWAPNFIVGIGGILLVVKSVREVTFIPWENLRRWFRRSNRRRK